MEYEIKVFTCFDRKIFFSPLRSVLNPKNALENILQSANALSGINEKIRES
ncbi:hypothetical protein [Saccharicrinis fermentans]|uniref:Uncharacterized protein n=1 Tax=Saccharicrinis fermentans DSM 9555 = JCM 21142 TaxID=869213 RepID=W7YEZ9_9BACT|nr:hypothetical protein [Saccharicrinis fermentans]GAF03006.1 hypothetical protein JCM21142_41659 [Saccharicrinis fermentans DSM 9555 = JCM 21142]